MKMFTIYINQINLAQENLIFNSTVNNYITGSICIVLY